MTQRVGVWPVYLLTQLVGALIVATVPPGLLVADVASYNAWAADALSPTAQTVVWDIPWPYPAVALLPMLAVHVISGGDPGRFVLAWVGLSVLAGAAVLAALLRHERATNPSTPGSWWWVLFTGVLAPLNLSRLDWCAALLSVLALLSVTTKPRRAGALLAAATWIKLVPALIALTMLPALNRHARFKTLVTAVTVAAAPFAVLIVTGAKFPVSFLTLQSSRAPLGESVPGAWFTFADAFEHHVWKLAYRPSTDVVAAWEVSGPGVDAASHLATGALALGMLAVTGLGVWGWRRGHTRQLAPTLMLALLTVALTCNKVLSPQYLLWLGVPVLAGYLLGHPVPANTRNLVLAVAALTTLEYPFLFAGIVDGNPWARALLLARNLTLVATAAVAVGDLWRLVRTAPPTTPADK